MWLAGSVAFAAPCMLIGMAIGATGIGGVLLVPWLCLMAGLTPKEAVGVAMWSYVFTGLAAIIIYGLRKQIDWRLAMPAIAAALPASLAGTLALAAMNEAWILGGVIVMLLWSGLAMFRRKAISGTEGRRRRGPSVLIVIGALTGFGSAVTGTGGPVIALPLLLYLNVPLLAAVSVSQSLQLPIAMTASAGHVVAGGLDLAIATMVAAILTAGTACGALLAPYFPARLLRLAIGSLALLGALGLAFRLV